MGEVVLKDSAFRGCYYGKQTIVRNQTLTYLKMENSTLIIIGLIAFIVNLIILFYLIRSATKAEEQIKIQKQQNEILLVQVRLLGYLLKKQGMDKDDINKIIKGTYIGEISTY